MFLVYFQVPTIISMCIDLLDPQHAKKAKTHLNFPPKLELIWSKTSPYWVHRIAGIKTLNLVPGWIFLVHQNRRYGYLKFHECKSNKIKGNQNNNKILIFFLIRPEIVKKFQIAISDRKSVV